MRTSALAIMSLLGLAAWQLQGPLGGAGAPIVQTAYERATTVEPASAPRTTQALTDRSLPAATDRLQLADGGDGGGNSSGVDTQYRT